MPGPEKKSLIIALGSEILGDDGLPLKISRQLMSNGLFPDVAFMQFDTGGLDILQFLRGYKKVIFIDTLKSPEGLPGDICCYSLDDFRETHHLSSQHDGSFLSMIRLGRTLYDDLPSDFCFIAIEIVEDKVFSQELSPLIQNLFQDIYRKVSSLV